MAEPIPEAVRIEVSDGAQLEIEWVDGAVTSLSAAELRALCQCAGCRELSVDERTPERHSNASVDGARLVGSYAVNFVFGPDGHSAGIFPFADLYRVRKS